MTCESCLQIIQPTVQPTITQCVQIVQAAPTIVPPDSINVLIGGVQQITYWSDPHVNLILVIGLVVGFVIGAFAIIAATWLGD